MPNPKPLKLQSHTTEKSGLCTRAGLPTRAPERICNLLAASLVHMGPKIFNTLLKEVQNITACLVETFKSNLGKFLRTVPDKSPVPGYTAEWWTPNTTPDQVETRIKNSGGPPWL